MNVVIAGGGTGGHVFPALALADRLSREGGVRVRFIGSKDGQERARVPAAGYEFHAIDVAPFVRELSVRALAGPLAAVRSTRICRPLVRGADVLVGTGGYVSVPAGLAAKREGVRMVLQEPNAVPGLANRLLARWARAVAISFEDARERFSGRARVVTTGYPIRDAILQVRSARPALTREARESWGLEEGRRTVLVFGGSQGALRLNEMVASALPLLADRADLQIVVLTGPAHESVVAEPAARASPIIVRAVPFLERMELAYAIADLVVSRSGATTIAELTACGLPAILVPYPHATESHQEANARELERCGAAEVLLQTELSPASFAGRLLELAFDDERLRTMGERATGWAKPDATERLAALVAEVAAS